ncbi:hypothetical protein [Providencia phage PSTRCR_114]|uniref:Uncharacterized protein n=1 Tax=Providencia phage PSTRCR_114 TaxID=2800824 RepID=A0A7T6ZMH4_9CAUD|nr:hypothetical protein [Providencia phage PSTRCR_114]
MTRVERKQLKRFGTTTKQALKLEKNRQRLMQESLTKEGSEARKRIKQLMTVDYTPKLSAPKQYTCRAKQSR